MAQIDLPFGFNRIYKGPAIIDTVFTSTTALNTYLTNPVRYAGMVVALVEGGEASLWQLNATEDAWIAAGGGGGLDKWITGEDYEIDDVVYDVDSNMIFRCIANHTSTTSVWVDGANWVNISGSGLSTGALYGLTMVANTDPALFNVTAGKYRVTDRVTGFIKDVVIAADITDIVVPDLATQNSSHVSMDKDGNFVFSATAPTESERRTNFYLGKLVHEGNTAIEVISNQQEIAYGAANSFADFIRAFTLVNIGGNKFSGTGLDLSYSGGKILSIGANIATDPNSPNVKTFPASAPLATRFRLLDSTQTALSSTIDPTVYESAAGVLTTITGSLNRAQIMRAYMFPSGVIRWMYGQQYYTNIAQAIQNIPTEPHVLEANIADNAVLVAVLIIRAGATSLTDPNDAVFLYPNAFGQISLGASGYSVSSLQNALDNSEDPEMILNDSGLTIKNNETLPIAGSLFSVEDFDGIKKQLDIRPNYISYEDIEGRRTIRKETNELFFTNFKDASDASRYFSVTTGGTGTYFFSNATVDPRSSANYLEFTQVGGAVGEGLYWNYTLPTWKEDWSNSINQLEVKQRVTGVGKFNMIIRQSDDNVTFTDILTTPVVDGVTKVKFALKASTNYVRVAFELVTTNDSTVLNIDRLGVTRDAYDVGQVIMEDSYTASDASSSSGVVQQMDSVITDVSGSLLSRTTTGDLIITAEKDCTVVINSSFLKTVNGSGHYAEISIDRGTGTFVRTTIQGRQAGATGSPDSYAAATWSERIKKGWRIKFYNYAESGTVDTSYISVTATAYADNAIVDAAGFSNTQIQVLPANVLNAQMFEFDVEEGVEYEVSGQIARAFANAQFASVMFSSLPTGTGEIFGYHYANTGAGTWSYQRVDAVSFKFTATSSKKLYVHGFGNNFVVGDGTKQNTYIQVTKVPPSFVQLDISNERQNSIGLSGNDGRAITVATEDIQFNGTGNGWVSSGDNHYYVVQKSGSIVRLAVNTFATTSVQRELFLYKNGTAYRLIGTAFSNSVQNGNYVSKAGEFVEGDQLSIRYGLNGATLQNNTTLHYLNIVEEYAPKAFVANAVSINQARTDGVPYKTGNTIDGKDEYEVFIKYNNGGTMSNGQVFATIASNLENTILSATMFGGNVGYANGAYANSVAYNTPNGQFSYMFAGAIGQQIAVSRVFLRMTFTYP